MVDRCTLQPAAFRGVTPELPLLFFWLGCILSGQRLSFFVRIPSAWTLQEWILGLCRRKKKGDLTTPSSLHACEYRPGSIILVGLDVTPSIVHGHGSSFQSSGSLSGPEAGDSGGHTGLPPGYQGMEMWRRSRKIGLTPWSRANLALVAANQYSPRNERPLSHHTVMGVQFYIRL